MASLGMKSPGRLGLAIAVLGVLVAGAGWAAWRTFRPPPPSTGALGMSAVPGRARPGRPAFDAPAPSAVADTAASGPARDAEDASEGPLPCRIRLEDVTAQTGITFVHTDGSSGRRYIVEAMSTGIATFDYDNDGLPDIYFPNGAPLPGCKVEQPPRHALYRNLGNWHFQDVTEAAALVCTAYGMGVTAADYDQDGDQDIYVSNFGDNILFRNNGDGTFTDVTRQAGVARGGGTIIGAGVAFLDADRDGLLDLYVGNYIHLDCAAHVPRTDRGFPSYPSPRDYSPIPDTLYRNNGDGTFADVSGPSGIAAHAGRSMGLTCADYDNDGDTDVFICNDVMENFLFRNDGRGHFEEVAVIAGVAMNMQGELLANMGVDAADFDHDGLLDFFTTNYQGQLPMLLRNFGDGVFQDVTSTTNAGARCLPYVNWGAGFVDFDNDGHLDLYIANGHTEDNIELRDRSTTYKCPNLLLRNNGKGRFEDISAKAGGGMAAVHASRGAAFEDLDNDGDIDVVVLNSREMPTVLRNTLAESGCGHHWLGVRLRGTRTNRDGIGAHVTVVAGGRRWLDEVHSGRSYQSHWGSQLHFGLGAVDRIDRIEVRWVGGRTDVFENMAVDQVVTLIEP